MFGGSWVLLLCAFLGMAHSLELRGAREGSCRTIQNIPTMDVDPVWLDSLHYINSGNKFHLYRQASTYPRFSQMREDEFYYEACFTKNTSLIEGNGSIFGFGGRVLGSFDVEPSRDPSAVVDAYPNNPQTGPRSDFFRQKVTLTDYRTFAVMVHCWMGVDQKSWDVYSLFPELDKATERLISDHVQALGFSKDNFVFLRYGHCKGLEASGGNKQGTGGNTQRAAETGRRRQESPSNRPGNDQGGARLLSRLNPKNEQRPVVDIPGGQDLSILEPKVRGVGLPSISGRRRNHIEDESSTQSDKEVNSVNKNHGGSRIGEYNDASSQRGSSQGGNRLERIQDGKQQWGNNNRESEHNVGGRSQGNINAGSRDGGRDDDDDHSGKTRENSSRNRGGNVVDQQQHRLTRPGGIGQQRPGSNNDQSGSIKRGIPSGGATTLKNAGGTSTTPSPPRRIKTSTTSRPVTKATQPTTPTPSSAGGETDEGHGWTTP